MDEESESSSSSSSEEEYLPEVNEEFEKSFFKTLSSLKNNHPSIYDKDNKFFDESTSVIPVRTNKNSVKEKPLFLKDYERKCITENEGYDDNREENEIVKADTDLPYAIEQRKLKESFKTFLNDSDDEEEANLLKPSDKSKVDVEKEEAEYIQWLKGQKKELEDKATEENLKNLRDYWNSDNLGEDEAFLRDYILNKKFIDKDESEDDDNGELTEDSETFEAQENFEQEYNLRYETGDNLIRRFPRNVEGSLRRKDNKRSKKRAEIKERKELDKKKKREEINRQKKLKVKEIAERLEKLKELTGNEKLAFNDDDILNDFDPAEHDRKMSEMYNEDFYNEEDGDKPNFNDLDLGDVEIDANMGTEQYHEMNEEPDVEEAGTSRKDKKKTRTKNKKERKKKSFSDISAIEKPTYDPKLHESYQKYMDEYYQLDCEDFIEDIPCRYKYKQVEPNDFGLSVVEILSADDKELNRWSSIKKIYKIRPPHVEKNEAKMYKLKGQNEPLKQKILPSLFKTEEDEREESDPGLHRMEKSKKGKKKSTSASSQYVDNTEVPSDNENISLQKIESNESFTDVMPSNSQSTNKKSKKRKRKSEDTPDPESVIEPHARAKFSEDGNIESHDIETSEHNAAKHYQNKPYKQYQKFNRNNKFKNHHNKGNRFNKNHNFHDSRLSAYGINPKKFKCKS